MFAHIALFVSCFLFDGRADNLDDDKALIAKAHNELHPTTQPVKIATSQPAKEKSDELSEAYGKAATREINDFRKDQISVQNGWQSYPKDFKDKTKNRTNKSGTLVKGPEDLKDQKYVVVYNVDDLINDIPDFDCPYTRETNPNVDNRQDLFDLYENAQDHSPNQVYHINTVNGMIYTNSGFDKNEIYRINKLMQKIQKAQELEDTIKYMLRDNDVKIITNGSSNKK